MGMGTSPSFPLRSCKQGRYTLEDQQIRAEVNSHTGQCNCPGKLNRKGAEGSNRSNGVTNQANVEKQLVAENL